MSAAIAQERCDGGCHDDEEQDGDDYCDDFHSFMVLAWPFQKQWQKCPKS